MAAVGPGRYFMPGPEDNTSRVLFDWHEFGRLKGSSLVWTEGKSDFTIPRAHSLLTRQSSPSDWFGDGSAFQWSYLASVMRLASEGPGRDTHRPRRTGETSFGGDIVPRAASGWPPDSGTTRQMSGGLFRKIMCVPGTPLCARTINEHSDAAVQDVRRLGGKRYQVLSVRPGVSLPRKLLL